MKRRPGDANAWYELGFAAVDAGELDEARRAFAQSVQLAPQEVEQGLAAADALLDIGAMAEAEHAYARLLERAPRSTAARVGLVRTIVAKGDLDAAAREIAAALPDGARDVQLRLLGAAIAEARGALAEAADHLAAVLAVEINHLEANRQLGALFGVLGDGEGAVRCWRRVVAATGGTDVDALTALGIALSGNGQHAEAIRVLRDVAGSCPDVASAHANLGMALLADGRIDEAQSALARALELDPSSAQAHCGLGLAHQRQGRLREAVEAFKATAELAPDHVVGAFNLGLALQALGDVDGARRALLRAAALDPDDEEIRRALEQTMAREERDDGVPEPAPDQPSIPLSMKGNLQSFQLFDVLEFLRLQQKTGALVVTCPGGAGAIRLVKGALTGATAPGVRSLAESLVARGLVRARDVSALEAAIAPPSDRRVPSEDPGALAELLLARKLVERNALVKAMSDQIMAVLDGLMELRDGGFFFHPGEEGQMPVVAFDLQEVMLEFLRTSDERKHAERSGRP